MNKLLSLALGLACSVGCGGAWAQTPAANPMPDGSRDMYVGLGVRSAPRYEGADSRKVSALPVLQVQWSSGFFISGMSAGLHLLDSPTFEFGPLLAVLPGRDESGSGTGLDGIGPNATTSGLGSGPIDKAAMLLRGGQLTGIAEIGARLQGGVFANYYLAPQWRLTSSVLYGSGRERDGARLQLGVQRLAASLGERHRVALSAGLTVANRNDNQTYFGVSALEASRSRFAQYGGAGGLRDAHLGLRWNWAWTPSWMLSTNVQAERLLGSARNSPLVERPTNVTVSTAIGYRF